MAGGPRIYNLFPLLAGPIPRWAGHLDRIARMNFDWIYLNPIQYPGFSGSLYAIKDPYSYHPLLCEGVAGDPEAALRRFLEEAAGRGIRVMCDLVIGHTSKDALLTQAHPEWFRREPDGRLRSPSAIDPADAREVTVWGDLAELDYADPGHREALMDHWSAFVLHQIDLGFRGFRCDAAYKVPGEAWERIIGAARGRCPGLLFCAETLGCRLEEVAAVTACGFDYLFNSSKWWDFRQEWCLEQYEAYRRLAPSISFPESHDTPRLTAEAGGRIELLKQRYAFAAFFSSGVMMPIGFEYGSRRRLDVVHTRWQDREQIACDLTEFISGINRVKALCPVLGEEGPYERLGRAEDPVVRLIRRSEAGAEPALLWIHPEEGEAAPPLEDLRRLEAPGEEVVAISSAGGEGAPAAAAGGPSWARPLGPLEIRLLLARRSLEGGDPEAEVLIRQFFRR